MSELIAIPLESDRRAVEVLATLRRLQAEYRGARDPAGADDGALPWGSHWAGGGARGDACAPWPWSTLIGGVAALVAGLAVAVRRGPRAGSLPGSAACQRRRSSPSAGC